MKTRRFQPSALLWLFLLPVFHRSSAGWSADLGVVQLPKMFAVAPLAEQKRSATVVMQPWARRVGGPDVAFGLPHQKQVRFVSRTV